MNDESQDKIAPGIYRVDGDVQVHVPELLKELNIPDTPETRAEMVKVVTESMIEAGLMKQREQVTVKGEK